MPEKVRTQDPKPAPEKDEFEKYITKTFDECPFNKMDMLAIKATVLKAYESIAKNQVSEGKKTVEKLERIKNATHEPNWSHIIKKILDEE
jgi:hypothetical protein